mmetsp:Transcript_37419/g.117911  ORF Transcript_37419/g.117911 Transcript_37419/m.117911 type:complete len:259 (+) Transcript_37419:3580-4356(+)
MGRPPCLEARRCPPARSRWLFQRGYSTGWTRRSLPGAPWWRSFSFRTSIPIPGPRLDRRQRSCLPSSPSRSSAGHRAARSLWPTWQRPCTLTYLWGIPPRAARRGRWPAACTTTRRRGCTTRMAASGCQIQSRREQGSRGWRGLWSIGRAMRQRRQSLARAGRWATRGCSAIALRPSSPSPASDSTRITGPPARSTTPSTTSDVGGTSRRSHLRAPCACCGPSSAARAPTSPTSPSTMGHPRSGLPASTSWRSPPATF